MNMYTDGESNDVRLLPVCIDELAGIMVPVLNSNEFRTSIDHVLNLGSTHLHACNQVIWTKCDVEAAAIFGQNHRATDEPRSILV